MHRFDLHPEHGLSIKIICEDCGRRRERAFNAQRPLCIECQEQDLDRARARLDALLSQLGKEQPR